MLLLLKGSFTDGEIVPLTLGDRVRPGIQVIELISSSPK